jgi:hypothetical protein
MRTVVWNLDAVVVEVAATAPSKSSRGRDWHLPETSLRRARLASDYPGHAASF